MSYGKAFTVTTHYSAASDSVPVMASIPIVSTLLLLAAAVNIALMKNALQHPHSSVEWVLWPIFSVNCICAITFPAVLPPGIIFLPDRIKVFIPVILIARPALYLLVGCNRRISSIAQHILKPWIEKQTCNGLLCSLLPYKALCPCWTAVSLWLYFCAA